MYYLKIFSFGVFLAFSAFQLEGSFTKFFFGLAAMLHLFGPKRPQWQSFYIEIATPASKNMRNYKK